MAAVIWSVRWEFWAAAGFLVLLLAGYAAACARALRPRAGTLEWIAWYDRARLPLAGGWSSLGRRDVLPLAGVCLAVLAAWGWAAWRTYAAAYGGAVPAEALLDGAVRYGLLPVLAAAAGYALVRGLWGSPLTACLTALAVGVDTTAEPRVLLLTAVPLLLLFRYVTAAGEEPFGAVCLRLILAFMAAAVAWRLEAALAGAALLLVLTLLAGAAARFVELGRSWLLRSLAAAAAAFLATALLTWVPAAAAAGMAFPAGLVQAAFYEAAARGAWLATRAAFAPSALRVMALLSDWPLLLCGLAAWLAAVYRLMRRRDLRAGLAALWLLGLTGLWLATDVYAVPFGVLLCLGSVWGPMCSRGRVRPVLLGGCALAALLAGQYAAAWIF